LLPSFFIKEIDAIHP
jgi:predicted MFS family arabinose efflux permease